jgi:hypothetical protein
VTANDEAALAFSMGSRDTPFYLGAMAHYIGGVAQYGLFCRRDASQRLRDVGGRVDGVVRAGTFESAIELDSQVRRPPFTAGRRVSRATFAGDQDAGILRASRMDSRFSTKPDQFLVSVEASLNVGVNELADVLHTFFVNASQR